MKKFICLLILIALFFPITKVQAQYKVKAEGMAAIHNNLIDIARDKAIENAQRHAVETVVGVMISSSTEVENFQLKLDRILSESRGFINNFKIISEKRVEDQYEVVIEAEVGEGRLKDRMTAINLIMIRKAKPRLMIIFGDTAQIDAVAESSMAKFFLSRGFRIHDSETLKNSTQQGNLHRSLSDSREAAKIARNYGAEIVVVGRSEVMSRSFTISGIEMNSNQVIVSVKVINADTGEVIATDSETASAPGMKDDFKTIAEQAAATLAGRMLNNVLERWSYELTNAVTVNVILSGLSSYEDLLKFKEQLPLEVKGFKALYQRSYQNGMAELDMEIKGNTQGLADDLAAMKLSDRKIKILEITQNRINAQLMRK
jgi:hypothetical protein